MLDNYIEVPQSLMNAAVAVVLLVFGVAMAILCRSATPPRFQFTIRGMLWATFWLALACGAWTISPKYAHDYWRIIVYQGRPWSFSVGTENLTAIVMVFCLFAACAAILNQHRKGMLLGAIAALGCCLYIVTQAALIAFRSRTP